MLDTQLVPVWATLEKMRSAIFGLLKTGVRGSMRQEWIVTDVGFQGYIKDFDCSDVPDDAAMTFVGEPTHGGVKMEASFEGSLHIKFALDGAHLHKVLLPSKNDRLGLLTDIETHDRGNWRNLEHGRLTYDNADALKELRGTVWAHGCLVFFTDDQYESRWVQIGR